MAKSILIRISLILIAIVVVGLGRGVFFYRGFYSPPPSEMPSYENFTIPPTLTTEFTDSYTPGEGIILIDWAHENAFDKEELDVLVLRLLSRGLTIKFLTEEDDLKELLLGKEKEAAELEEEPPGKEKETELEKEPLDKEEEEAELKEEPPGKEKEEKLPDAFMVISPQLEFSREEVEITDNFTRKGGKLLLIADPTRSSQINSLAIKFGVIFESDYLYNMKENEINYRNIFVSEFKENGITKGLKKIALYTAGSVSSNNASIAFVDQNTFSSLIESRKRLSPIALAQETKVLAIYDFTFLTEPYNGILDNNQLISNIADWLMPPAKGRRTK